jgi:hypothetical protein
MIWSILANQYVRRWVILAVTIACVAFWGHHKYNQGYSKARAEWELAQKIEKVRHDQELKDANHANDQELDNLRAYRDANPVKPVRLCIAPRPVRPSGTPADGAGAGSGDVQPVPAGDTGSGADGAGPDIAGLLESLAAVADAVSADLREEQAVK